jgi:hypothetical protein
MYINSGIRFLISKRQLLNNVSKMIAEREKCSVFHARKKILYDSFVFGSTYSEYAAFDFYHRTSKIKTHLSPHFSFLILLRNTIL